MKKLFTSIALVVAVTAVQARPVTIEDCIRLVRIQQTYNANDRTVIFSPDGRQLLTMTWRGNLERNVNEYTVLVYDAQHLDRAPKELLKVGYTYDTSNQHARPLSHFSFIAGGKVAMLATFDGKPRQVVTVDMQSGTVSPVTRHPDAVLAFAAAPGGKAMVFAAEAPAAEMENRKAALRREGFSLEDRELIGETSLPYIGSFRFLRPTLEYFLSDGGGGPPRRIYQGPAGDPTFWMSPDGRHAVVYPYVPGDKQPPTVGLIDMSDGSMEPLITGDIPAPGRVLWARDSQSLLMVSGRAGQDGVMREVVLSPRQERVSLPWVADWEVMDWSERDGEVLLTRSGYPRAGDPEHTLGTLRRTAQGWQGPLPLQRKQSRFDLNPRYYSGTNGRLIVGVKDNYNEPSQLAAYDRTSKQTRILTDLNPQLRELTLGEITPMRWTGSHEKEISVGHLIKPVGYVPGKRYPLIIQFKDEGYYPEDPSFIFDGAAQYSGAAMQVWANQGFMVLFPPAPQSLRAVMESLEEDERITAHVESGLDVLESQGLIDRSRVALAGWSRAGWWTEAVTTRAKTKFAAAANIDNVEYNTVQYSNAVTNEGRRKAMEKHWGGLLPWGPTADQWRAKAVDMKYATARTPRLIEIHGASSVPNYAGTYAALKEVGIPIEFYVYPDASHSLKSPRHRYISLSMHTDWFRFWLQNYEDPAPEKRAQYERWRKLRDAAGRQ